MRELKFRLWDGNNKCFSYPDDIELNRGLEYQQYTGLKDYLNREVYEGDIIEKVSESHVICWNNLEYHLCWCAVPISKYEQFNKYQENRKGWHPLETDTLPNFSGIIRVIGNVWETPELLEAK